MVIRVFVFLENRVIFPNFQSENINSELLFSRETVSCPRDLDCESKTLSFASAWPIRSEITFFFPFLFFSQNRWSTRLEQFESALFRFSWRGEAFLLSAAENSSQRPKRFLKDIITSCEFTAIWTKRKTEMQKNKIYQNVFLKIIAS